MECLNFDLLLPLLGAKLFKKEFSCLRLKQAGIKATEVRIHCASLCERERRKKTQYITWYKRIGEIKLPGKAVLPGAKEHIWKKDRKWCKWCTSHVEDISMSCENKHLQNGCVRKELPSVFKKNLDKVWQI